MMLVLVGAGKRGWWVKTGAWNVLIWRNSDRRLAENFVENEGAGEWWSALIDCHDYLPDQLLGLESNEDANPGSDGSDEDAPQGAGPTGGIVSSEVPYVASRLDDIAVRSPILPQEEGAQ